ncbi:MAG TPA: hypothetical protein VKB77_03820 [Terriglobales bacterium]|nr:hypothetical protein [Terriglobales bacterium]
MPGRHHDGKFAYRTGNRVNTLVSLPLSESAIHADLEIQFAGQTAEHKQVPFQLTKQGNKMQITGTIPAMLADFKIDPPSLLTLPVKNEIPVRVEMTWESK